MNICKIFALCCLIITSNHAVEIQNHSTLPALIDNVVLSFNTGLGDQPSIQERNINIAPGQRINHKELSGQTNAIVLQVALASNNIIYVLAISPERQQGHITINTHGHITSSEGINLIEQRSAVAPTRSKPVGPRMI